MRFSKIKFGHICSIMILVALLVFSYMFYVKEGMLPPPLQLGQPLPPATKEEDSYNSRKTKAHLCVKKKCNKYKKKCTAVNNTICEDYENCLSTCNKANNFRGRYSYYD